MQPLDSSSAVKVSAPNGLFPDDIYSPGCLWFVSNVFLLLYRCKSTLLTILKKHRSLNHMKQHTPCMIYLVQLSKYDHSPTPLPLKNKDFSCNTLNI
jgi:hypothetical protein